MQKRKYFVYGGFGHITCYYRNMESKREKRSTLMSLNKFEVLASRVMNMGILSKGEERKDRKIILRKERLKEEKISESEEDKRRKIIKRSNG